MIEKRWGDQLLHVAEEVPGFGGMFYDGNGNLNIYLLNPDQPEDISKALAAIADALTPSQVKVLKGQYAYLQLREWYWQAGKLLRIKGIVFMKIDEARNRVVFGIEKGNAQAREHLERRLAQLPIPREAVLVDETVPAVLFPTRRVGLHGTNDVNETNLIKGRTCPKCV